MMALDGLNALEARIHGLVQLVHDLRQKNSTLEQEIRAVRQSQEELNQLWEKQRTDIQCRIEKVLGDIDLLELADQPKEVSL